MSQMIKKHKQAYKLAYECKSPSGKTHTCYAYFTDKKLIYGKLIQWSQQGYEYYQSLGNLVYNHAAQRETVPTLHGIWYGENAQDHYLVQ